MLERALTVPERERAAFLLKEAGTDEALRAEVEGLLTLDEGDGLDPPDIGKLVAARAASGSETEAPSRLGAYRILRRIGQGGMGDVFLGVRADGQFKKRVAIKVIKRGMDTEDVLRRFERERQVLANLEHPGIARLIDGGMAADGRPFLVMEFIEGEPLMDWCDSQRLSVQERVELFGKVCDAIHEAHKNLVVHRDLKPSNILITHEGQPKLLDFGIAKVLDPEAGDSTVNLTATPLQMLTPAYASPEQVMGKAITTSSDIYSLGVLLYQLLVGRTPYTLATRSPLEIERLICKEDTRHPGQALGESADLEQVAALRNTTPRALERRLRGDLGTVVLKALRKEPRRRYSSASELAEDLRKHLRGLPVSARPDTVGYRLARFVDRNRYGVGAAAIVIGALLTSLIVVVQQSAKARRARDELARQLEIDRERSEQLAGLTVQLTEQRQAAVDARAVVEERAVELGQANADLEASRALAERRYHAVREIAKSMVFDVHRALVPIEGALQAKELVVGLGTRFLDGLVEEGREDPDLMRELVQSYVRMASLMADDFEESFGRHDEALSLYDKAQRLAEDLCFRIPGHPANEFAFGLALMSKGDLLVLLGRSAEAIECFRSAAEVCGLGEEVPKPSTGRRYALALSLLRLGAAERREGRLDDAEERFEGARGILRGLASSLPTLDTDMAELWREFATVRELRDDPEGAIDAWRQADTLFAGASSRDYRTQRTHGLVRRELARLLIQVGRLDEARPLIEAALEAASGQLDRYPRSFGARLAYSATLKSLADLRLAEQDWPAVRSLVKEQLSILDQLLGEAPENTFVARDRFISLNLLVAAARGEGAWLEADEAMREALDGLQTLADQDPTNLELQRALASAYRTQGDIYEKLAGRPQQDERSRDHWLEKARASYGLGIEGMTSFPRLTPVGERLLEALREGRERCGASSAGES